MFTERKNYPGIDVSKLWFDVSLIAVAEHAKQPVITQRFDNTPTGMKGFKKWLKLQQVSYDENSLLVIENTGVYHRLLWSFCSTHNLQLHIGNAAHIKWSLGITRGKNDVIDSKRLCMYCLKQADELKATPVPDPVFMFRSQQHYFSFHAFSSISINNKQVNMKVSMRLLVQSFESN